MTAFSLREAAGAGAAAGSATGAAIAAGAACGGSEYANREGHPLTFWGQHPATTREARHGTGSHSSGENAKNHLLKINH